MSTDAAESAADTLAPPVAFPIVEGTPATRWIQLGAGVICMAMIANLQYGWTLFVDPISRTNHWDRASVQLAFTFFVMTETWMVPLKAWFGDRYGAPAGYDGRRGPDRDGLGRQRLRDVAGVAVSRPPSSADSARRRSTAPASATR